MVRASHGDTGAYGTQGQTHRSTGEGRRGAQRCQRREWGACVEERAGREDQLVTTNAVCVQAQLLVSILGIVHCTALVTRQNGTRVMERTAINDSSCGTS